VAAVPPVAIKPCFGRGMRPCKGRKRTAGTSLSDCANGATAADCACPVENARRGLGFRVCDGSLALLARELSCLARSAAEVRLLGPVRSGWGEFTTAAKCGCWSFGNALGAFDFGDLEECFTEGWPDDEAEAPRSRRRPVPPVEKDDADVVADIDADVNADVGRTLLWDPDSDRSFEHSSHGLSLFCVSWEKHNVRPSKWNRLAWHSWRHWHDVVQRGLSQHARRVKMGSKVRVMGGAEVG
jgi:hypothetical protein